MLFLANQKDKFMRKDSSLQAVIAIKFPKDFLELIYAE